MDYEKAYKAVLQTATQWIKDGCTDKERICLECVFPELRESEDEKIRKDLIAVFETIEGTWCGISVKVILAYLERQKKDKVELVYRMNGLMQDYIKEGKDDEEKEHRLKCYQLFWDALEDANFFEQKEQKPTSFNEPYNPDEYEMVMEGNATSLKRKEQKPAMSREEILHQLFQNGSITLSDYLYLTEEQKSAEWSNEDEKKLRLTTALLQSSKEKCMAAFYKDVDESVAWLQSLRPQQKQEWSEEEQQTISFAVDWLTRMLERTDVPEAKRDIESVILGLKSLRPVKQEWGEGDEHILKGIIGKIDHDQTYGVSKAEMLSFLKRVRPQMNPIVAVDAGQLLKILPKRQEWSEEDKETIEILKKILKVNHPNGKFKITRAGTTDKYISTNEVISRLESLCPQPHLKPSEEQMMWLKCAVDATQGEAHEPLLLLYYTLLDMK